MYVTIQWNGNTIGRTLIVPVTTVTRSMFSGGSSGGREASWEGAGGGTGGALPPQVFLLPVPVGENIEDQELEIQLWEQGSTSLGLGPGGAAATLNANLSISSGRSTSFAF